MSSAIKRGSIIQFHGGTGGVGNHGGVGYEEYAYTAKVSSKKKGGWLRARYLTPPKFAGRVFSLQNSKYVVNITPVKVKPVAVKVSDKFDDAHRTWVFKTLSEKLHRPVLKTLAELFQQDVMDELSTIWKNIDEEEQQKWNSNGIEWVQWLLYGGTPLAPTTLK